MLRKTNAETVRLQNDLRRLCQLYVMEHHPSIYQAFQKRLGITRKTIAPRLVEILDEVLLSMEEYPKEEPPQKK